MYRKTRLIAAARGRRLPLYNLYIFNDVYEHFYDMQRHRPQECLRLRHLEVGRRMLVVVVEVNHATFCDVTANLNVPLQT